MAAVAEGEIARTTAVRSSEAANVLVNEEAAQNIQDHTSGRALESAVAASGWLSARPARAHAEKVTEPKAAAVLAMGEATCQISKAQIEERGERAPDDLWDWLIGTTPADEAHPPHGLALYVSGTTQEIHNLEVAATDWCRWWRAGPHERAATRSRHKQVQHGQQKQKEERMKQGVQEIFSQINAGCDLSQWVGWGPQDGRVQLQKGSRVAVKSTAALVAHLKGKGRIPTVPEKIM